MDAHSLHTASNHNPETIEVSRLQPSHVLPSLYQIDGEGHVAAGDLETGGTSGDNGWLPYQQPPGAELFETISFPHEMDSCMYEIPTPGVSEFLNLNTPFAPTPSASGLREGARPQQQSGHIVFRRSNVAHASLVA